MRRSSATEQRRSKRRSKSFFERKCSCFLKENGRDMMASPRRGGRTELLPFAAGYRSLRAAANETSFVLPPLCPRFETNRRLHATTCRGHLVVPILERQHAQQHIFGSQAKRRPRRLPRLHWRLHPLGQLQEQVDQH